MTTKDSGFPCFAWGVFSAYLRVYELLYGQSFLEPAETFYCDGTVQDQGGTRGATVIWGTKCCYAYL